MAADALDLVGALDLGVAMVSPEWRVVFANQAWRALPGALHDPIGRDIRTALPAFATATATEPLAATLADGEPRSFRLDHHATGVDGTLIVRARRSAAGMLVCVVEDATEHARLARQTVALSERNEENESLHALARAMSAVPDSAALLRILCEAAVARCGAVGATVAQLRDGLGEYVAAVGHPLDLCGSRFALEGTLTARVIAERAPVTSAAAGASPDAAYFPQLLGGARVGPVLLAPLVAHDALLGVLAVSRPEGDAPFSPRDAQRLGVIADHAALALWKSQLFEEAQAASQTKSSFLAAVSHELRTPLTALTGYGELLADEEIVGPMPSAQHDIVERMRSVTHHLTAMIEEILTFSSLEAGRELVRPVPSNVPEVVAAAASIVAPLAALKSIDFGVAVAADVPVIVTDPDKLRQILVNLLGNAVKFTERGTVRLDVTVDAPGAAHRRVCFAVCDSGIGIAPDDLSKLFHPFTQLDVGLTRRFGGTGLGLYISRELATLLGGRVDVESQVGAGSTFKLSLPVARSS